MSRGQIVTFYSYKGGVGRTMALANVAALLAQRGKRVLAIDFDLEAPGLHRYLLHPEPGVEPDRYQPAGMQDGLIDFFRELDARSQATGPETRIADTEDAVLQEPIARWLGEMLDSRRYLYEIHLTNPDVPGARPLLHFMAAGRFDDRYAERIQKFDWREFYAAHGESFDELVRQLKERFDYILIDARTGLSDIGSISTIVLPDRLVLVCAPNRQSIHGALEVGRQVALQKRSLLLVPLMARLENAEKELQQTWIDIARQGFEAVFREVYGLEHCNLGPYLSEVRVPHDSFYSYGELIAAERESASVSHSLTEAYAKILPYVEGKPPWEARPQAASMATGVVSAFMASAPVDRAAAQQILGKIAALGIRPWIPEPDAGPLREALLRAIQTPACRSMVLFLSRAGVREHEWVAEIQQALMAIPEHVEITPIALDPLNDIAVPAGVETLLRARGVRLATASLDPEMSGFAERFARRVLDATNISREEELVLHLGHRRSQWDVDVPPPWRHLPVLDLRLGFRGERDFSPSSEEWQEIHDKAAALNALLPRLRRLDVFGLAPLGVGAIVGKIWDRGTGVTLHTYNSRFGAKEGQVWSSLLDPEDEARTGQWQPEDGRYVRLPSPPEPSQAASTLLLALVPVERSDYLANIHRWNQQRAEPPPVAWIQTPVAIASPEEARLVLVEILGAFRFLRRAHPHVDTLDVITTLPLAMMPLLGHHLRQFGAVRLFDQVMQSKDYRLAVSFH